MAKDAPLRPWTTKASEKALETPWFTIIKNDMITGEGVPATYFVHHSLDSVICFCVTGDNKVLIERQYRPPVGKVSVDFPAGRMEPGDKDNPATAIVRELKEEVGFVVDELEQLATLDVNPAFSTGRLHVFLARGRVAHTPLPDKTEHIVAEFVTPAALFEMIKHGELCCLLCVSTTYFAGLKLGWLTPSPPA